MREKMEKKTIKWKRRIEKSKERKKERKKTINSNNGVGQGRNKEKIIIKIFPEIVVIINSQQYHRLVGPRN